MKRNWKRGLAVMLSCAMLVGSMSVTTAFADDAPVDQSLEAAAAANDAAVLKDVAPDADAVDSVPSLQSCKPDWKPGKPDSKPDLKPDWKPGKPDSKPDLKPDWKPGKPDCKPDLKPDWKPGKPDCKPDLKPDWKPGKPDCKPDLKPVLKEVTVTFDPQGGAVTPTSAETVNRRIAAMPVPTREGYEFLGWYTSPNAGVIVNENTTFVLSMTVYAHWKELPQKQEFTITFDPQGGVVTPTSATTVEKHVEEFPVPTKEGYNFVGWFTCPAGGVVVNESTVFLKDMTVYAQWVKKVDLEHTITFDPQGGAVTPTEMKTVKFKIAEYPVAEWDGHEFQGWYTCPQGGLPVTPATVYAADMTVYAHWELVEPDPDPTDPDPKPEPKPDPDPTDPDPKPEPKPDPKPQPEPKPDPKPQPQPQPQKPAEAKPVAAPLVQTGDSTQMGIWVLVMGLAAAGVVTLASWNRKKNQ